MWTRDRQRLKVSAVSRKQGSFPIFNFEVAQWHSYFVGDAQALVHNDCWSTIRKRYWIDRFQTAIAGGEKTFSQRNLTRMAEGTPPQQRVRMRHRQTGAEIEKDVSVELHHLEPQRNGGPYVHDSSNLQEVTPWEHETIDAYRHVGYDLVETIKDIDIF